MKRSGNKFKISAEEGPGRSGMGVREMPGGSKRPWP